MKLISKRSLLTTGAFAVASALHGNVLAHESFDYPTGTLVGAAGGVGFVGAWQVLDTFSAVPEAVVSPGLTHPLFAGTGNAWADIVTDDKPSAVRSIDPAILESSGLFDTVNGRIRDGESIWYSFLVYFPVENRGGLRVKFFGTNQGPSSFWQGIGINTNYRAAQDAVEVKFEFGDVSMGSPEFLIAQGETHLLVGSFEAGVGTGNDTARIWVNPPSMESVAALGTPTAEHTGTFVTSGSFVTFRGNNAALFTVDELQVMSTPTAQDSAVSWYGYPISAGGYVDTDQWMGMLWVEVDPWVYSFELGHWLFIPEDSVSVGGAWSFLFR